MVPQEIRQTFADSEERWPAPRSAPPGSPNVLVILLDDVGFAQLGCFGSSIRTPAIDRLAAEGLRYTNFHTTAICSPTRASLLTGRNPHSVGFSCVTERMAGYPGHSMQLPDSAMTVAEILRRNGWATRAVGKWHLTPSYEVGPQGPYDRWPLGRGFDRFYGFLAGAADQYRPELVRDNSLTAPPRTPEEGYHLSEDLVDESIRQLDELRSLAPGTPFLHYLALGAAHSPHQVPPEWIERYHGVFDDGWDVERERVLARQVAEGIMPPGTRLGPSNPGVADWQDLSTAERAVCVRMMEVYAGYLEHADAQIGRLLDHLERIGTLDDTLVVLTSDNGASGEGGPLGLIDPTLDDLDPDTHREVLDHLDGLGGQDLNNHYPWGWAQAGNTPFRWYKQFTHAGGNTNGLIIRWPGGGVPAGGLRRQYHHVVDLTPTVLDVAGVAAPATIDGITQQPMHGVSMRYSFHDAEAPTRRRSQHYEMLGNRGFHADGWMAVSRLHPTPERPRPPVPATPGLDEAPWELYHHHTDPTECDDLAEQQPERLRSLVEQWWAAAARYDVLPVDDRPRELRMPSRIPLPAGHDPERTVFHGPGGPYERGGSPRIHGVGFRMTAEVTVDHDGGRGVLFAMGGRHGGYCWYLRDGRMVFEVTTSTLRYEQVVADRGLAAGPHALGVEVVNGPGSPAVRLSIDGRAAGGSDVAALIDRFHVHAARSSVGFALDRTGSAGFVAPYGFTGELHRLVVEPDAQPDHPHRPDDEHGMEMREQ